jgi:hypothetical protein
VFLLDMSTSVCSADGGTAFGRVKDFLRATVSDLPVAPTQFRVAVVGYSSSATISIDFTIGSNRTTTLSAIDALTCAGGARRTDLALRTAREQLFNPFTSRRSGVAAVLVLVGVGGSTLPFATVNETAQLNGIQQLSRYVVPHVHPVADAIVCLL